MPLEAAQFISDLVPTNPSGGDSEKQGDDHIRLMKQVLLNTFPNLIGAINFGAWARRESVGLSHNANAAQTIARNGGVTFFDLTAGPITYSLLAASAAGVDFLEFITRNNSESMLTIQPAGAELIGNMNTLQIGPGEFAIIFARSSSWWVMHSFEARPGTIKMTGSAAGEIGWKICNGAAFSRTTFSRLFNAITTRVSATRTSGSPNLGGSFDTDLIGPGMPLSGTGIPADTVINSVNSGQIVMSNNATSSGTSEICVAPYGVGDGSTTFNVPDMRGRAPVGSGSGAGLTNRVIGVKFGAENVTLSLAQMPIHDHGGVNNYNLNNGSAEGSGRAGTQLADQDTATAGGGEAHPNVQPSVGTVFRIKT